MTHTLIPTINQTSDPSLQKQQLYRKYTKGELSWYQVAEGIEKIQPNPPELSRKQRIAFAISTFLLAMLIPAWAKREE